MGARIRKIVFAWPFAIEDDRGKIRHQKMVFSVDDTNLKMKGYTIHSISESYDEYAQSLKYSVNVSKADDPASGVKIWKEFVPHGCSKEIEYYIED